MKLLPRAPTPEMVEAGQRALEREGWMLDDGELSRVYRAMWDASPTKLKRTDPPTEPGLYWARLQPERKDRDIMGPPGALTPVGVVGARGLGLIAGFDGQIWNLDAFWWYGRIAIPEVEE